MNTDLFLAQNHAFQLSRTLMVPVTLFRTGDEFGVCRATNSMTKTIWRSCMNMFRVGLIETLYPLGAACERQAAREAAPPLAGYMELDANLQVASRALASFALRGPPETVPQMRET
jgi:hypothetical protein